MGEEEILESSEGRPDSHSVCSRKAQLHHFHPQEAQWGAQPAIPSFPLRLTVIGAEQQESEEPSYLDAEAQRGKGAGSRSQSNQWKGVVSLASSVPLPGIASSAGLGPGSVEDLQTSQPSL